MSRNKIRYITTQSNKNALVSLADGYAYDTEAGSYCTVDENMLDFQVICKNGHLPIKSE